MYGCESWTIKKAEHERIYDFELWCWRRLLRVPWTARTFNQSILKEISPWCSLEGLMLKLKLQYFDHLMQRADSFEKTLNWERLKAGGEREDRGWDCWMSSLTQWILVWVNSGSWWWTGRPGLLKFMGLESQTWLIELNWMVALMATSSKRAYAIPNSAVPRAPVHAAKHHQPVPLWETHKCSLVSVSVRSLGPCVHKGCLSPLSISGGNGVWF